MDQNSPSYYIENSTETSLNDTQEFIDYVKSKNNELINPIVTPRFAISCSENLMHGLAELAINNNTLIQTHLAENKDEVAFVSELYPNYNSYTQVYNQNGLIQKKYYISTFYIFI